MKQVYLLIILISFTSMAGYSQTAKQKLQQVKQDPQTAVRAAKADVHVASQKSVISGPANKTATVFASLPASQQKTNKRGKKY